MQKRLIFAKKLRLPSTRANVLQSLNMALAFSALGRDARCFPGCAAMEPSPDGAGSGKKLSATERRGMTLRAALQGLGTDSMPEGWRVLPGEHKGIYGTLFRWALLKEACRDKHAVFYSRDTSEATFLCGLKRVLPLPLVFEAHEVLHLLQQNSEQPKWKRTLEQEKRIFSCISGLVVINEGILEDVRSVFGYAGPVLVAENGFNPALFHPLPLFSAGHPWPGERDTVRLVYVGNFLPGKGVRTLLDAMILLPERFHLRLVGGHPQEMLAFLRAKAQSLGLEKRVEFYGAVQQQDVARACLGMHMFIVPQQSAYFFSPLKLYEAIAMGLPVITTPISIFKWHIESGFVSGAPDSTPAGLAAAIERLAANSGRAHEFRERALREAAEHTWEKRAQKIVDFTDTLPLRPGRFCRTP